MTPRPEVVAFDVVETLFALDPVRDRMKEVGLRAEVMPLWFAGFLRDAFALDVAGTYMPFKEVAQATLRVVMANEGVFTTDAADAKIARVLDAFAELTAHPDVRPAFDRLRDAKVRIVTLTNGSAENTKKLLERAGLAGHVEKTISIDEVKRWKPAAEVYLHAAKSVGVDPGKVALVAAHAWDVHGAKRAGLRTGWVVRKDKIVSPAIAPPDAQGKTLTEVVERLLGERS